MYFLMMFSVGHRPSIYTVLCILYGRITTAVGCLSDVNSLYGRIAFNTYESCYTRSVRNVPTTVVIPTPSFMGPYQTVPILPVPLHIEVNPPDGILLDVAALE